MIKLRDLLETMDDYQCITIVQECHEIHTCVSVILPLCAINILKESILEMNVVRIEGSKIYIDGGNGND